MTVQAAQLSTLLEQLKREELEGAVQKSTLLKIALYVLGNSYSRQEYKEATVVLAKYHLWRLIDKRRPIRSRQLIENERSKHYNFRCCRCGRPISSKKSLETGLGCVCRSKATVKVLLRTSKGERRLL